MKKYIKPYLLVIKFDYSEQVANTSGGGNTFLPEDGGEEI